MNEQAGFCRAIRPLLLTHCLSHPPVQLDCSPYTHQIFKFFHDDLKLFTPDLLMPGTFSMQWSLLQRSCPNHPAERSPPPHPKNILFLNFMPYTCVFFLSFKKNYSQFTMLCQFMLYSNVSQSYMYMYILFLILSSIRFYHKQLDIVFCAV